MPAALKRYSKIVLKELIHSKHRHCAELVQAEHSIPELIVPPKHEHDSVALFDAEGLEIIRRLRRSLFDILEAETALLLIGGYVEQGELVGRFIGNGVDDIVGEIEFVGVFEFYSVGVPLLSSVTSMNLV